MGHNNTGLSGDDIQELVVKTKEDCCGHCKATSNCAAADFSTFHSTRLGVPDPDGVHLDTMDEDLNPVIGYKCHLKSSFEPKTRGDGSIACVPKGATFTGWICLSVDLAHLKRK